MFTILWPPRFAEHFKVHKAKRHQPKSQTSHEPGKGHKPYDHYHIQKKHKVIDMFNRQTGSAQEWYRNWLQRWNLDFKLQNNFHLDKIKAQALEIAIFYLNSSVGLELDERIPVLRNAISGGRHQKLPQFFHIPIDNAEARGGWRKGVTTADERRIAASRREIVSSIGGGAGEVTAGEEEIREATSGGDMVAVDDVVIVSISGVGTADSLFSRLSDLFTFHKVWRQLMKTGYQKLPIRASGQTSEDFMPHEFDITFFMRIIFYNVWHFERSQGSDSNFPCRFYLFSISHAHNPTYVRV
ncbi:alanyl-tRNA synthetase [Striga asiatica]|uniref:Alanyl-tRNA synthetase n=1 Tax=Striga asiatica TaxID=4170 RepID=A0A5A7P229_STRAF|nr:alanyl-tRNA synthetase [Striga asiatica]